MEPVVNRLWGFKKPVRNPAKRKACQSDPQLAGAQKRIEIIDDMFGDFCSAMSLSQEGLELGFAYLDQCDSAATKSRLGPQENHRIDLMATQSQLISSSPSVTFRRVTKHNIQDILKRDNAGFFL